VVDRLLDGYAMEKPNVSVVIPTYNAGATIALCLNSVRNQSYSAIEVIVVDNFSNDATSSLAKACGAKVVQQRSTPALARNVGIANSMGEYVFFVDSDHILSQRVVEECVTKCVEENAGMVRVPELFVGEGFWGSCSAEWKNYYGKVEQKYGARGDILSGEPRFFVKEQIVRVGMFASAVHWGEDYDLYQRLKEMGVKEASCKSMLYHCEPVSVRGIMTRYMRYGESMPAFMRHSKEQVFSRVARHSLLAWEKTLSELGERPGITLGCTVLLGMKAFALMAGLLASLA
jgi:glycosyltransferase involved in cell wall biosynthesis